MFSSSRNLDNVGRASLRFNKLLIVLVLVYFIEVILHIVSIGQYNESPFSLATSCIMFMLLFAGWYGVQKRHTSYLNLYFVGGAILVVILVISSIIFLVLIAQMNATLSQFNQGLSDVSFTSDGVYITKRRISLDTAAAIFSIILSVLQAVSCAQAGHIRRLIIRNYRAGFPPNATPVVSFPQGSYTPPVIVDPKSYQSYQPYPQQPQGAPQYDQYASPQQVYLYPNYPPNNNNNTQTNNNQGKPNPNPYSYEAYNEPTPSNETTSSP